MVDSEEEARAFVRNRCDAAAFVTLEKLIDNLRTANASQNLVAQGTLHTAWQRHVADSAQLVDHVSRETGSTLDLGSGAGFPGLVLGIMRPQMRIHLIEARRLRIEWLHEMINVLACHNCNVIGANLRNVETFEAKVIVARAFAPLERLVALAARFSTSQTQWLLPKGRSAVQEVETLPIKLRKMFHVEQSVTDPESGVVIGTGRAEVVS